ncbi:hypothetical protein [Aeromonas dhakensis]|uniref:hypothetical protein n=1 Tax=Aeromonas dhakensis TaxID=196024 RepID=UPI0013D9A4B6|nr:hypothetical protein [Aeromonas dhakensis]
MKFTWLTLSGNPHISDKTITFTPQKDEDDEVIKFESQHSQTLRSNYYFQGGEIEFDVMLSQPKDKIQLLLGTDGAEPLNVGINSNIAAYGIAKFINGKYEVLSSNGIGVVIEQNSWINVLIRCKGSDITMYINGVKVCHASAYIHNSQISLLYRGVGEATIRNFSVKTEKPNAFIVMQFTDEYNTLYNEIIKPICEDYGFNVVRADNMYTNSLLIQDITSAIRKSSLVLADITPDNPNVYYEVGFSHALEKPTILLCDRTRAKLPFDISSFRCIFYENSISGKSKVEDVLKKHLDAIK